MFAKNTAFITGCQERRKGSSYSKDSNLLLAFREGLLKTKWRIGSCSIRSYHAQFLIEGNQMRSQESALSVFRFQLVWELHVHGHHAVRFFHLVGISASAEKLKDMAIIYRTWGGTKGPWFCFMAKIITISCRLTGSLCFCIYFLHFLNKFTLWNSGKA